MPYLLFFVFQTNSKSNRSESKKWSTYWDPRCCSRFCVRLPNRIRGQWWQRWQWRRAPTVRFEAAGPWLWWWIWAPLANLVPFNAPVKIPSTYITHITDTHTYTHFPSLPSKIPFPRRLIAIISRKKISPPHKKKPLEITDNIHEFLRKLFKTPENAVKVPKWYS